MGTCPTLAFKYTITMYCIDEITLNSKSQKCSARLDDPASAHNNTTLKLCFVGFGIVLRRLQSTNTFCIDVNVSRAMQTQHSFQLSQNGQPFCIHRSSSHCREFSKKVGFRSQSHMRNPRMKVSTRTNQWSLFGKKQGIFILTNQRKSEHLNQETTSRLTSPNNRIRVNVEATLQYRWRNRLE